jgi:subtilisin family serine protease
VRGAQGASLFESFFEVRDLGLADVARPKEMLVVMVLMALGLPSSVAGAKRQNVVPPPTDPLYAQQWHLPLIKATDAWQVTRGEGVVVQIVDDGVQIRHPELSEQYVPELSHNFNYGIPSDPSPGDRNDRHGTACAGVATGRNNSVCGVGTAYRARLAAIRLISGQTDDALESEGITYGLQDVGVMSCSWGPTDDGRRLEGPGTVTQRAMEHAAETGRRGRGSIWVWAGGNGGAVNDNCNYDGYANHPLTIAVGAMSDRGTRSPYSEECAALLITAPSSGGSRGITTCDLLGSEGYDPGDCTNSFGGTSSAAPLVAGVVGLLLSANQDLGWKDVQFILMSTAQRIDATDVDWVQNGAKRWVNHKYGYGLVDANAAVRMAKSYTNMLSVPLHRIVLPLQQVNKPIPQSPGGPVTATFTVVNVTVPCEAIQVVFSSSHSEATELRVTLISPMGTRSTLADLRAVRRSVIVSATPQGGSTTNFASTIAAWGASPTHAPVLGAAVQFPSLACGTLNATDQYRGMIVVVSRGVCPFYEKAANLERLGAKAVVVMNNVAGEPPLEMSGGDPPQTVAIPVVMITYAQLSFPLQMSIFLSVSKDSVPLTYSSWAFTSMRHWGENVNGVWKLVVEDLYSPDDSASPQGDFQSWQLVVWNDKVSSADQLSSSSLWDGAMVLVAAGVFAAIILAAAGGVLIFLFVKKRGPFARFGSGGDDGSAMTAGSGLAMEEDFDFGEEANADELFMTETTTDDDNML